MPKSPSNQIFDKTSFLHGANATYVEEMFKKYSDDPSSVPNDWGIFFKNINHIGWFSRKCLHFCFYKLKAWVI